MLIMPVIAYAEYERQLFADGILVLKIERPDTRRAVVIQIQEVGLDVVIHLLLLKILAPFGAQRDLVPSEKHTGSITLKVPPGSIGRIVVLRERRDTRSRIVVDIDSVVVVPVVRKPSQGCPIAEGVAVLHVGVTPSICCPRSRVVKDRAKRGGRNVLCARAVNYMNVEIPIDDIHKHVVRLVFICVYSKPIV